MKKCGTFIEDPIKIAIEIEKIGGEASYNENRIEALQADLDDVKEKENFFKDLAANER